MFKQPKKVKESSAEGAVAAAISLLAYKENTEKELYDKLILRGFSEEDASSALRFVTGKDYLSEKRYFTRFAESCAAGKYLGKRRILQEARKKGFSEKTLQECAEETFEKIDFNAFCYAALQKLGGGSRRKATAALLRRGYGTCNVSYAFRRYEEETGAPYGEETGGGSSDGDWDD